MLELLCKDSAIFIFTPADSATCSPILTQIYLLLVQSYLHELAIRTSHTHPFPFQHWERTWRMVCKVSWNLYSFNSPRKTKDPHWFLGIFVLFSALFLLVRTISWTISLFFMVSVRAWTSLVFVVFWTFRSFFFSFSLLGQFLECFQALLKHQSGPSVKFDFIVSGDGAIISQKSQSIFIVFEANAKRKASFLTIGLGDEFNRPKLFFQKILHVIHDLILITFVSNLDVFISDVVLDIWLILKAEGCLRVIAFVLLFIAVVALSSHWRLTTRTASSVVLVFGISGARSRGTAVLPIPWHLKYVV